MAFFLETSYVKYILVKTCFFEKVEALQENLPSGIFSKLSAWKISIDQYNFDCRKELKKFY